MKLLILTGFMRPEMVTAAGHSASSAVSFKTCFSLSVCALSYEMWKSGRSPA